jgi:hypothetical protein
MNLLKGNYFPNLIQTTGFDFMNNIIGNNLGKIKKIALFWPFGQRLIAFERNTLS